MISRSYREHISEIEVTVYTYLSWIRRFVKLACKRLFPYFREEGIKKGMEVERKILIKLKEGSTDEELIKLGYTSEAIESAKETLKLILA